MGIRSVIGRHLDYAEVTLGCVRFEVPTAVTEEYYLLECEELCTVLYSLPASCLEYVLPKCPLILPDYTASHPRR
jgi:hypothetical protein